MQYRERYTTNQLELILYNMFYSDVERASNALLHMRDNAGRHWFANSEHRYFQGSQPMVGSLISHSAAFCASAGNLLGFDGQIAKQSLQLDDIGY